MNNSSFCRFNTPITQLSTYPQIILQTLQILIAKIIELTNQIQLLQLSSPPMSKPHLINISQRSNQRKSITQKRSQSTLSILKIDFQSILNKLSEFKNSSSFDKKMAEMSPPGHSSFQYEEIQLGLLKIQEQFKKQVAEVRGRLINVQDDIGQILLLYKQMIIND